MQNNASGFFRGVFCRVKHTVGVLNRFFLRILIDLTVDAEYNKQLQRI